MHATRNVSSVDRHVLQVSWGDTIEFGAGLEYGIDRIMSYRLPDPDPFEVKMIAFTTLEGEDGEWTVQHSAGMLDP